MHQREPEAERRLAPRLALAGLIAGPGTALLTMPRLFWPVASLVFPMVLLVALDRWPDDRKPTRYLHVALVFGGSIAAMLVAGVTAAAVIGLVGQLTIPSHAIVGGVAGGIGAAIFAAPWKVVLRIGSWTSAIARPFVAGLVAGAAGMVCSGPLVDSSDDPTWLAYFVISIPWHVAVGWALGSAADMPRRDLAQPDESPS